MKVWFNQKCKNYPHSLADFLKCFNRVSLEVSPRKSHADFNWLVKKMATELKMTQVDVVRSISILLRKSKTFRIWTWFFPSFSGKGSVRMNRDAGWCPREPFDFATSRKEFTNAEINCMVIEVKD